MAPGAMEVVAVYFGAWLSYRTRTRVIPGLLMYIIAIVGGVMMIAIPKTGKSARFGWLRHCFCVPGRLSFLILMAQLKCIRNDEEDHVQRLSPVGYSVGNLIVRKRIEPRMHRITYRPRSRLLSCLA